MSRATLGDTVAAVPQLGEACSSILETGFPGSGLKRMRLVSKQLRSAMLGTVQGYTLRLDGNTASLGDETRLLQSTRLSRLKVVVTPTDGGSDGLL